MFFNNILDEITDILIYYYSISRRTYPTEQTKEFLRYHLQNRINKYPCNRDEISSVVVTFGSFDDLVVNNLDNVSVYRIKQYIESNVNDTSISLCKFRDFSISLNVCPFEGLTIDSSFVISVCDCMMY